MYMPGRSCTQQTISIETAGVRFSHIRASALYLLYLTYRCIMFCLHLKGWIEMDVCGIFFEDYFEDFMRLYYCNVYIAWLDLYGQRAICFLRCSHSSLVYTYRQNETKFI